MDCAERQARDDNSNTVVNRSALASLNTVHLDALIYVGPLPPNPGMLPDLSVVEHFIQTPLTHWRLRHVAWLMWDRGIGGLNDMVNLLTAVERVQGAVCQENGSETEDGSGSEDGNATDSDSEDDQFRQTFIPYASSVASSVSSSPVLSAQDADQRLHERFLEWRAARFDHNR